VKPDERAIVGAFHRLDYDDSDQLEAEHGPGPSEATAEFLAAHSEFRADSSHERFLMTFNPGGYLKRFA
jgi:cephalosporin hydroxylase